MTGGEGQTAPQLVPDPGGMREALFAERIRLLYGHLTNAMFGGTVVAFVTALILWPTASHRAVGAWFACLVLVALGRAWLARAFRAAQQPGGTLHMARWAWLYTAAAAVSGVLWGSLPWLAMDVSSLNNSLIICLVLFGMIASSIGSHAAFFPAFLAYAYPVAGLLVARLIFEGGNMDLVATLVLVFLASNTVYARNLLRTIQETLEHRYERDLLLTDVQNKRQEAERANIEKSRFIASTSHDLRQPLYALNLYLGAVVRETDAGRKDDMLRKARQSAAVLRDLLNSLMDISRLDAGSIRPEITRSSLAGIIEECAAECAPLAGQKGLKLRTRCPAGACALSDSMLFGRMLRNLLSNAVRHTERGSVLVGARRRGDRWRVEVWDSGPGIPEEKRELIFSEYFQLGNPERDREKGLGLGLAIVRRLSALLDHPVEVRSRPGKGSCFCITVPACDEDLPANSPGTSEGVDIAGRFVLLVDDDAVILDAMRNWLRGQDCEVLTAGSGDALLAELSRLDYPRPDVVLADYRLRDEQVGTDVVQAVRRHFNARIPAIVISGDTAGEVRDRVRDAGCMFLSKPVDEGELLSGIAALSGDRPDR